MTEPLVGVINAGSSSLKFSFYDGERRILSGQVDGIGVRPKARAMGADIVIAVHLETAPLTPDEPLSAFTVLQHSVSVVISVNELESMKKADILIPVHTEDYSSIDFQASKKLIELGYAGAQERARLLERLPQTNQGNDSDRQSEENETSAE